VSTAAGAFDALYKFDQRFSDRGGSARRDLCTESPPRELTWDEEAGCRKFKTPWLNRLG